MKAFRRMIQQPQEEEDVLLLTEPLAPAVRVFGAVNWIGLMTLTSKEIHRFLKIFAQTILSPLIMTLLFYAMFALGTQGQHRVVGIPLLHFVIPGLIIMSVAQSAFVNNSISLILSKLQGNIVDVLMPPLSPLEMTISYAVAGAVRGLIVGGASYGVLSFFMFLPVQHIGFVLYHAVMGSMMLSLMGLMTGIWGDKFDHMGGIQNFIIMPATFLSGTFFSVASLPEQWRFVCFANPFFYMIDGFRYGFIGVADGSLWGGLGIMLIVNLVLFNIAYWMFARGTFLKS